MKVLYDHQAFTVQDFGGISRYFVELFRNLRPIPDLQLLHTPQLSNNAYLSDYNDVHHLPLLKSVSSKHKQELMRHFNNLVGLSTIPLMKHDVFHPTYYDPYFLRLSPKKPFVVTIHDMIHEKFSNRFPALDTPLIAHKKQLLYRSAAVIAVSESTKKDILELYDIPAQKIRVVPLASAIAPPQGQTPAPESPFLLYVGNRNLYKNFPFFVEALAPLLRQYTGLKLICAGGGGFAADELLKFSELQITHQVQHSGASDSILSALYSQAVALVFPSLYEGFGIPILEAMGCGCPVLASQVSSVPEVGADAARYFCPTDKEAMQHAIKKVLDDAELRQTMAAQGKARAAEFSWEKTAALTHQVYQQIA